jgi:hypothetical protein
MFVPEDRAKHLQTLLNLTDTQTVKITGYYKALVTRMDSVVAAGGNRDDFGPLMAATKVKIKAVLTPEQNIGYEKMLREQMKPDSTAAPAPKPKND